MNLASNVVSQGPATRPSGEGGGKQERTAEGDGFAQLLGETGVAGSCTSAGAAGTTASDGKDGERDEARPDEGGGQKSPVTSPALLAAVAGLTISPPARSHSGASPGGTNQGPEPASSARSAAVMPARADSDPKEGTSAVADASAPHSGPLRPGKPERPSGIASHPSPRADSEPQLRPDKTGPDPNAGTGGSAGPSPDAVPVRTLAPADPAIGAAIAGPVLQRPSRPQGLSQAAPSSSAAAGAVLSAIPDLAPPAIRGRNSPQPSGPAGQVSPAASSARPAPTGLAALMTPSVAKNIPGGDRSAAGDRRTLPRQGDAVSPASRAAPSPALNQAATPPTGELGAAASLSGSPPIDFTVISTRVGAIGNTLVLQLQPRELGAVTAQIRIGADMVKVDLKADTAEAARLLASGGDTLRKALESIGIGYDMHVSVTISGPSAMATIQGQPSQSSQTASQSFQFSSGGDRAAGGNPGQGGGGRPSAGDQFGTSGQSADGDTAQLPHRVLHGMVV